MNIVRACVRNPVSTMVGVILAVLFGSISLFNIPVQMTPTVDRPIITVDTEYLGAAPSETEEEITNRIEEKLTSVEGVSEMASNSEEGRSRITLEFDWNANKDLVRLDVSEKLGLVRDLPLDSERPLIQAANSDEEQPIARIVLLTDRPINEVRTEAYDVIRPKFERVPGVGGVEFRGGEERQARVTLDIEAMSARDITISEVRTVLLRENRNTKGGKIDEGKNSYVIRTVGQLNGLDQLRDTIIANSTAGPVFLGDIANISFDHEDRTGYFRINRKPAIMYAILRRTGANSIEVMNQVYKVISDVNRQYKGKDIKLELVRDETDYIYQSRRLVVNNIYIGGALAIGVLLVFLGSVSSVFIIAVAIPVATVSTFIFIFVLGRSINIISLAGLAFAVGMVVDNSIVVLENIYRHREMGKDRWQAAIDGGTEVWGAVLASTLTTLAVFIPVIFVQEEVGQLFRDIAITISVAVSLSLIVSITLVPMMSARLLRRETGDETYLTRFLSWMGIYTFGNRAQNLLANGIERLLGSTSMCLLIAGGITAGAVLLAWLFFPPIDYLPKGNRNGIFTLLRVPAGYNLDQIDRVARDVEKRYANVKEVERFVSIIRPQRAVIIAVAKDKHTDLQSMRALTQKLRNLVRGIPGVRASVSQVALFRRRGSGFIGGVNIEVDIKGSSLEEIQRISSEVEDKARELEGVRFVNSSFDLGKPELQVLVDRRKAADLGLSVTDVGYVVESLVNGTRAGVFRDEGKELDIVLRGARAGFIQTQQLEEVTLHASGGKAVKLNDIAAIKQVSGPTKIEHTDRDRSVKLTVSLNDTIPMQTFIDVINEKIIDPMREQLPLGYSISVSGQAKSLERTWDALKWAFLLAVLITYLLMAALFEAWSYPLIIMFSVPLAATGGVLAVSAMNWVEPTVKMDTLTMLGFIILTGIVVNNAILLVHQALNHQSEGMPIKQAIIASVRDRMRPIFMTTTTTVLGMLPLVLSSGSGSELYRGLGSAILGGLSLSTIFTLVLIPVVFSLWVDFVGWCKSSEPGGAIGVIR